MRSCFFPLLPDPRVIEEGHTQSITTLFTVESLYQVGDILDNILGAAGCAAAVKGKLATGNATDYLSISRLLYALVLQLPLLGQFETLEILTVPLKNTLRQPGHEWLVWLIVQHPVAIRRIKW